MQDIEVIKEKNAVLVPIEKWEKVQKELSRLRKKVRKAKILNDIKAAVISIEDDLKRPAHKRKIKKTAYEFLDELLNEQ